MDEITCEHCTATHARQAIFMEMAGPKGERWWLCYRCWRDGLKPKSDAEMVSVRAEGVEPSILVDNQQPSARKRTKSGAGVPARRAARKS